MHAYKANYFLLLSTMTISIPYSNPERNTFDTYTQQYLWIRRKETEIKCRFLVSFPFKKWVILILCSPINNWLNDWLNSFLSLWAIFQPYNNSTYKRGQLCFHFLCTKPKDIKTMACNQKKDLLHIMHK